MFLKTFDSRGDRWLLWPIRLRWVAETGAIRTNSRRWVTSHGWQVGTEVCAVSETGKHCMPGYRGVFGRTLHFGRLKVLFGRERSQAERGSAEHAPPRAA